MAQFNITITEELLHGLFLSNGRDEAFSKLLEEIFNQVLLAQSTDQIRAQPYERTEERTAYRNGFRDRQMTTRVGTLTLWFPGIAMDSSLQSFLLDTSAVNKRWCWL